MKSTRREVMMFAGGSALGIAFTPAPWRLITDSALWSENWPGVPVPARGEARVRYTNCSLCTAGCAVRARCVGDQPIALTGANGGLCAFGLAGHHLPYLPTRVKEGPAKEAAAAVAEGIAKCGPTEYVATLDLRPSRTASWTYRRAMNALPNGRYVAPPIDASVAVDLSKARTVLSFGVPVLDGWGTPANVIAARGGFRLIQVEALESRTASLADRWLRVRAGSEDALAQALASSLPYAAAAEATGLTPSTIADLASELEQNGPVLVVGSAHLASSGHTLVTRLETPVPAEWQKAAPATDLASLPDRSVRVLLIDESSLGEYLPWSAVEKKLVADNPVVVAFAWSPDGYARHAHYVLPTGVYPEVVDDVPPAIDSVAATFRISTPLVAPPAGIVKPEEFVARAAGLPIGDTLRERADSIHKMGRGSLLTYADAKSVAVKDVTADVLWKALNAGGRWIDAPDDQAREVRFAPCGSTVQTADHADFPLAVLFNRELPGSPILSKLYQESNLRLGTNRVALNPASGFETGAKASFRTALGVCPVTVLLDAGVPPGAIAVTASPAILDVCAQGAHAKVVRI